MAAIQIDPKTGERIEAAPQIDPATGERVAAPPADPMAAPVAGAGPLGVPSLPAHPPADMQPSALSRDGSPGTVGQKLFGDKPFTNTATVVGQHLKNLVTAPYHAVTDAPTNAGETAVSGAQGPAGLAAYRMLAEPTIEGKGMDRIPIVGPWARNVENDAQTYGAIPALFGLATDVVAPKATAGMFGNVAKGAGFASKMAAATPEARGTAYTRMLVPGSPGELLNRSLKPPVTMPDFEQSVEQSLPKIAAQNPKGVSGFADAANNAKTAEQQWYQKLKAPYQGDPIDTTPAVGAQLSSVPATNAFETPSIFGSTAAKASPYDMSPQTKAVTSPLLDQYGKPITSTQTTFPTKPTLDTVDSIRKDTNSKLKSFYNQEGGDRYAALSNPETARLKSVNDSTRDLVYGHLSSASGVPQDTIAANQRLYGQLSDVADVAGKRATVAGRANPMSLQETLALKPTPMGVVDFGAQRLFKGLTNSDSLTNAAVDRFKSPGSFLLPPRSSMGGQVLSEVGNTLSSTGNAVKSLPRIPVTLPPAKRRAGLFGG